MGQVSKRDFSSGGLNPKLTAKSRLCDSYETIIVNPCRDAYKSLSDSLSHQSLAKLVEEQRLIDQWKPGNRAIETMMAMEKDPDPESILAMHRIAWTLEAQFGLIRISDRFCMEGNAGKQHEQDRIAAKELTERAYVALTALWEDRCNSDAANQAMRCLWSQSALLTISLRVFNDVIHHSRGGRPDVSAFTKEKYTQYALMKHGTWHYSLPFTAGAIMSEEKEMAVDKRLISIWTGFGFMEQLEYDYCDCFNSGGNGRNLFKHGYICWPIVDALTKCSQGDREFLVNHYGDVDDDFINDVIAICEENGVHEAYQVQREVSLGVLYSRVKQICRENPKMPAELLNQWLDKVLD
jgi:hypothetical protein